MADRIITHSVSDGNLVLSVKGQPLLVFHPDKASAANRARAELHGWTQRISDAAALDKGATAADKHAAMAELVAYYEGGEVDWARKGGGGARPFDVGLVVTALCNVKTGGDVDKANRVIDAIADKRGIGRTEAAKLFAADESIAVEMARIRAARAPAKFDADEALLEMETAPE